ncbi:MAG: glycosyltransferase family 9 protein [Candidatus Delongbacteria bacterium]|nr:glycosyltransferase family 9 protein [Candidatus Delongbacteria bacterium]
MKSGTVVIHTAFIGDLVLLTPLLARLRERFPDEPLHLVTTPVSAVLFEKDQRLDSVLLYDKRGRDRGLGGFFRLLGQLRKLCPQRVLLPHRYLRTSILGLLAGAREVSGFTEAPLSRFFYRRISYPPTLHETRRMWSLLEQPPDTACLPLLELGEPDITRFKLPRRYLVLAPGSVWRSKRWPGFGILAGRIRERYQELVVVLIGASGDSELLGELTAEQGIVDLTGATNLRESAAILAGAAVLICHDSAALHLGQAVATPTLAIFGSTVVEFGFGPQGKKDRVISRELPCRPCARHGVNECLRKDFACLNEITPGEVMHELKRYLPSSA